MKNTKNSILFAIAAITLFLTSCTNLNNPDKLPDFSNFSLDDVQVLSPSEYIITVGTTVENPVNKKFAAKDFTALVYRNGKEFADVEMIEPIKIQQLYLGKINAKFKVKIKNITQAIKLGLCFNDLDPKEFTADINSKLKAGVLNKRFKRSVTGTQVMNLIKKKKYNIDRNNIVFNK